MTEKIPDVAANLRDEIDGALAVHDREAAYRAAVGAVERGEIELMHLYRDVLTPLLIDTGTRWQTGAERVWEEHLASQTIRLIIDAMFSRVLAEKRRRRKSRKVLLACPPEEPHDLGIRMLSDHFETAGWDAYLLGADTPEAEIVDAARRLKVDAVALTVSTHYNRLQMRDLLDRLEVKLPGVRIWVGGSAFARDHEGFSDEEYLDPAIIFEEEW